MRPYPVSWYRPSDGSRNSGELRCANASGLGVALWSTCPYDWDATPSAVRARLDRQWDAGTAEAGDPTHGAAGAVIALHTSIPPYLSPPAAAHRPGHDLVGLTAAVLDALEARGVRSVTLSDLVSSGGGGGGPDAAMVFK